MTDISPINGLGVGGPVVDLNRSDWTYRDGRNIATGDQATFRAALGLGDIATLDVDQLPASDAGISIQGWTADNLTDNSAVLQAALTAAEPGAVILLPPGIARIAAPITITKGVTIRGTGNSGANIAIDDTSESGTIIRPTFLGGDVFSVQTDQPVVFDNLEIGTTALRTSGATIGVLGLVTSPARSFQARRVKFVNAYDAIRLDFVEHWTIKESTFVAFARYGVNLTQNNGGAFPDAGDFGDATLANCWFYEIGIPAGTSEAGFFYKRGGTVFIYGNKFLGSKRGVQIALAATTGTLLIAGNSFEQQTKWNIDATQAVAGSDFASLQVQNNQFSNQVFNATSALNPLGNVHVAAGTASVYDTSWLRLVSITGNTFNNGFNNSQGAQAMILVEDGVAVDIARNLGTNNSFNRDSAAFVGVPLISVLGGAQKAQLDSNLCIDNPAGTYGPLGPTVTVVDRSGPTKAFGDQQRRTDLSVGTGNANLTHDFLSNIGGLTSWTTLRTFTDVGLTSAATGYGIVDATVQTHTANKGVGGTISRWSFIVAGGTIQVQRVGTDVTDQAQPPGFRLVATGTSFAVQIQSSDGTNAITAGTADVKVRLPATVGQTANWTVS